MSDTQRADQSAVTAVVVEQTPDAALVSNLGVASYILAGVEDRPRNFYMRGAMGVTTPMGLGLALAIDDQVTVLDGDGSLLLSLGSLATVARQDPANLVVVVVDNGEYATTGGQRSLSDETDFAAVARATGLAAWHVSSVEAFADAYAAAVAHDGAALVACDVVSTVPDPRPDVDFPHAHLTHRFRTALGVE